MRVLRRHGKSYRQIADILKVNEASCYYWLNQEKQTMKRVYNRKRQKSLRPEVSVRANKQPPILPWQRPPEDTRPLSARILGDPLPGRSALDMKMKENLHAFNSPNSRNAFREATKDKDTSRNLD